MFVTLDQVARAVIIERFEPSMHNYAYYLQFCFDCARDHLQCLLPHYTRSAKLTVNPNNTVDLPPDFTEYIKMGEVINGRLMAFSLNEDMMLQFEKDNCGEWLKIQEGEVADGADVCFRNFEENGVMGTIYGYRKIDNPSGNYRMNYRNGQLQFDDNLTATEIYMEYKSNRITSSHAVVPVVAYPVMKKYTHWMKIEHSRTFSLGEKARAEDQFKESIRQMRAKVFRFTYKEFLDVMRQGAHQGVKR
jgi:hypothetical protein